MAVFPATAASRIKLRPDAGLFHHPADQVIDSFPDGLSELNRSFRVLLAKGYPGDDVIAEMNLRVQGRGNRQPLPGLKIEEVDHQRGRPDIHGQAQQPFFPSRE